ncbi:MAG: zinc-binding dehydrogenase [Candidatus Schekmanbacteria bacterium]|nr:zinc-binding dehydrogenase [Candidatus Schekmanbacteria bacterium]
MKAAYINNHGTSECIKYGELDKPITGKDEVLIKVSHAALNHLDIWVRSGIPGISVSFPHILGSDGSGTVEECGAEVTGINQGDKVVIDPGISCGKCAYCRAGEHSECSSFHLIGEHIDGTFAEYVKAPSVNVHPAPRHLTMAEAAAFPLTFLTAWRMLITKAKLIPGESILIMGIGGGVATAALQISKAIGVNVIVTSGDDEKIKKALGLGAAHGINYRKEDVFKRIREITLKECVDVVLDNVAGDTWEISLKCLKKGGRLVTCGATTGGIAKTDVQRIFWNQLTIYGSTMGTRGEFSSLLQFMNATGTKPIVDRVFPLKDAAIAQKHMEEAKQFGKIVLQTE